MDDVAQGRGFSSNVHELRPEQIGFRRPSLGEGNHLCRLASFDQVDGLPDHILVDDEFRHLQNFGVAIRQKSGRTFQIGVEIEFRHAGNMSGQGLHELDSIMGFDA